MVEQSLIEQLFAAIGHAPWPVLAGYIVLVVVAAVRSLTSGRLSKAVESWVSASSAMAGGAGLALAAGGVWWQALILALVAAPTSRGFWEKVRKSIPRIGVGALLVVALLASGCGAENRCLAERTTVAALGVAAGMASGLVPDTEDGEQAMAIVDSSLTAGGALVSACEQLRDDRESFSGWLTVAVAAVKAVLGIIRAAGVDIPDAVDQSVRELERLLEQRAEPPPIAREAPYQVAYFD